MRHRNLALAGLIATTALASAPAVAAAETETDRFALANGCFTLTADGKPVAKAGSGYVAGGSGAEAFRMKATDLGRYLFYGKARDYLAVAGQDGVEPAAKPSLQADWRVDEAAGGTFRIVSRAHGRALAVGPGGKLVVTNPDAAGRFAFERASGCPEYPEIELNVSGGPHRSRTPFGEVRGFIDAHMHHMAFEFLGGKAHCGRPWHPYGVTEALVDCPDHYPGNGAAAVLENVLFGNPARTHDPVGWPTFKDWPHHASLTHEQSYYRWVERAWRGGLRVFVNLLVDNEVLCKAYPYKKNPCSDMNSVRLQARRMQEFQDYVDAQAGGPGKGFYRIVKSPFEARRVIAEGKLAVVMGIEVSKLFDCGLRNGHPTCSKEHIDKRLQEVYDLGVRDLELVNKFDNGLAGVAGDGETTGVLVNNANKLETGRYWDMETCRGPGTDRPQYALPGTSRDQLVGNAAGMLLPPGAIPLYPPPPHCNRMGLTDLGEHLVRRMIQKGMIIDPDHLSVYARNQLLAIVESERYSGIVSSHSWSSPDALPRIYRLGGVVTPYAGSSKGFVEAWKETKPMRSGRFYFGFGYGADMNGFGAQGGPREGAKNPVRYPFKLWDGKITVDKQRSGERVYDINKDGVAHYGLYPDWIEDLRMQAGDAIVKDMERGAEAYLQMWERAEGIRATRCRDPHNAFGSRGLGSIKLGVGHEALLRAASQPNSRKDRVWRWCVHPATRNKRAKVTAVLSPTGRVALVASTAPTHRGKGVGTGDRATKLRGKARRFTSGVYARRTGRARILYGVRKGRVRWVAVASRTATKSPARLRGYLRQAGLR